MRRVGKFFDRRRRDRDLDDELAAFVDELTERNLARGMTPDAARRAALVDTGGVQQVRELTRDTWQFARLETLLRDVRAGCRLIARAPGFACVVVATLALVIGATATMFSVMHAVLWQPLPYPAADRLVVVEAAVRGVARAGVAGAEARELLAEPGLFEQVATLTSVDAHVAVNGVMERVAAASATDEALRLLGAEPLALGRRAEARRDGGVDSPVRGIVISHALWQRLLGGDPSALGRRIEVNNLDVEIVGILRPEFRVFLPAYAAMPEVVDVWFPRGFETDRRNRGPIALARLGADVSLEVAQSRLDVMAERWSRDHAAAYGASGMRLFADPLERILTADVAPALWILTAAVAFVLIIGCVNVANLMLARARTRAREIAVRRALGASQLRLVRQLFTEALVLSAAGAAAGFVLAHGGITLIDALAPRHLPRQSTVDVTAEVALFTAAVTVMITLVFALVPAFASRGEAHEPLKSGRASLQHPGMRRLQRGLVVAEVALSIVPLVAAGLMLRTFVNLTDAPIGFRPDGIVTAKIALSFRQFPATSDRWHLHRDALAEVRRLPAVRDVSAGAPLPFDDVQLTRTYGRDGESPSSVATAQSVLPGYLRVTGVALLSGRDFTDDDITGQRQVAIVDQRLADQLWPDGAIGQRVVVGQGRTPLSLEVIGVTSPVRMTAVRDEAMPHIFLPFHVFPIEQALVIRTDQDAATLSPAVKRVVEALGTRRPVHDIRPLQAYVDESMADSRFMMLVLGGFGVAAVLLAAVGLYGTLAYLASLRTQEFGVRLALGASTWRVVRSVTAEGLVLAGVGAAIGCVGAAATVDAIEGLLYNVTPLDGVTLTAVVMLVSAVAVVATIHPAWRASQTSPTLALRAGE